MQQDATEKLATASRTAKISDADRLCCLYAIIALAAVAYIYGLHLNGPPIRSDGIGYQAYLPAFFIDHDLTFKTFAGRVFGGDIPDWTGISLYPPTGNYLDKFPIGTALLQAPFFLIADGITVQFGLDRSGVSGPYQIANVASGIFYFLLGIRFIYTTLQAHFEKPIARLTVWLIAFGTNVFHYATYDGSFSHIYSFALMALFVNLLLRYHAAPAASTAALIGSIFGLIIITRVNNGIVGLIALSAWIDVAKSRSLSASLRHGALFLLFAFVAVAPQFLYWQVATHHFLIYSYREGGFDWAHPHLLEFLFSTEKGLFFWSPALFISVIGFFAIRRELRFFAVSAFITLALHAYVSASWANWTYGGGYGSRPFVEMMPVLAPAMAAGLAFLVAHLSNGVVRRLVAGLIGLNLFLMNGYWIGVIQMFQPTIQDLWNMPKRYIGTQIWHFRVALRSL
jgi:hypothetical protein